MAEVTGSSGTVGVGERPDALVVRPSRGFTGEVSVPGDKSISHRAVMLGALAEGTTRIANFLAGHDCLSTVACFRALGVPVALEEGAAVVEGGAGVLAEPADVLDCGNSGTTMRLLLGVLSGRPLFAVLTGDASLRRRPMGRVVAPLRAMGAFLDGRAGGELAPLAVRGGSLRGGRFRLPVASAQVKSALLLAGLAAEGVTEVEEPAPSRDHTERMLRHFGVVVEAAPGRAAVAGPARLVARDVEVPGDISAAVFFLVAGAVVPGSRVVVRGVGVNPTRAGALEVLAAMGARVRLLGERQVSGEPVADLEVESSALKGVAVGGALVPRLIDEVPALAVAAACAEGVTEIRDAAELRVKESDRIAALASQFGRLGVRVEELPDGLRIHGGGGRRLRGAEVESGGDHRLAMALAVAGLVAEGETVVRGASCADVSFPGFEGALALFQDGARTAPRREGIS